jgi:hypothetical protein
MAKARVNPIYINRRSTTAKGRTVVTVQTCTTREEAVHALEMWFDYDDQSHYYICDRLLAIDLSASIPPWKTATTSR